MVVQVAVAMVLLAGASVMMRSMVNLERVDAGFDQERLLTAMYSLAPADVQAGVDPAVFHVDFLNRIRGLPGVVGATLGEVPMGGPTRRTIVMGSEGRPELTPEEHFVIRMQPVADDHMSIMGAQIVEGRDIQTTDDWNTEKVMVLSRKAAEELFPDGSPIGRRVKIGWAGFANPGAVVVGVVEGLQMDGPAQPDQPQGYVSVRQAPQLETGVIVRTSGDPESLIPALRSTLAELDPNIALTSVMSMDQRSTTNNARPRVVTMLLALFGAVSLFLVAAGLYGTIAFAVARRTKELGLRASLGAGRWTILTLVLKQGVGVTLLGILVGLVGSRWGTRFLEELLFGTTSLDPVSLIGVAAVLFVVALVATYVPARRALRIDPMSALRTE
jgi:putative ABC transport system permease protein